MTKDDIGATIHVAVGSDGFIETEAEMLVRSLLSAGVDTTVTGIENALVCLTQHPQEWAKLKSDPDKFALPAFEETLRYTSPVQAFCRTANLDTDVAGIKIEEGTKILCVLGAANRDPAHWDQPDRFDISRNTAGHLALGVRVRTCVEQNIARAEGQAVLRALAERVDRIEMAGDPVWRANNGIYPLDRLPLRMIPT